MNRMNKNGGIFVLLIILAILTVVIIGVYLLSFINDNITAEIKDSDTVGLSPVANETIQGRESRNIRLGDEMMVIVFFGWLFALVAAGFYTDFHPATIAIFLVIGIIGVLYSAQVISNGFDDINTDLSGDIPSGHQFTLSSIIFGQGFPLIILFVGVLIIGIIVYSRKGSGQSF